MISGDEIFQAKGHNYSASALVGGDKVLAANFSEGNFATVYLSPRDYHRVHMPCKGRLLRMVHVPGSLFSVNPLTVRGVPGLFARNERVICVFESDDGPFVMVLVGATIVGSISTVWHGVVNPPRSGEVRQWQYVADSRNLVLQKGEEMGRFQLGSTVIMLFPKNKLVFNPLWKPGAGCALRRDDGVKSWKQKPVRYPAQPVLNCTLRASQALGYLRLGCLF